MSFKGAIFESLRFCVLLWLVFIYGVFVDAQTTTPNVSQASNLKPDVIVLPLEGDFDFDVGRSAVFMSAGTEALSIEKVQNISTWRKVDNVAIDGTRANPDLRPTAPYATGFPAWIYFSVSNPSKSLQKIVINTQRPDLRLAELYSVHENGNTLKHLSHSYKDIFSVRDINTPDLAVKIDIQAGETRQFYMRYLRSASEAMPLKVSSETVFQKKTNHKAILVFVFLTFMITVLGLTLFAWPALGWKITLTWFVCVSLVALWFAGVSGVFFQYVTPNNPYLGHRAADFFGLLTGAAFINIGRVLFKIREISKLYDKVALGVMALVILVALTMLVFDIYAVTWLAYAAVISNGLAYLIAAINVALAVYAKRSGSTIILLGGVALVIAHVIYNHVTSNSGGNVAAWGRYQIVPLVSFIEISCFTAAIVQVQMGVMRQRDVALKDKFKAVQGQLRLNEALHKSEMSYHKAMQQAELRRERLSFMSHDILQPLTSLKTVLGSNSTMNAERKNQMQDAFDYLEALARENLNTPAEEGSDDDNFEIFSTHAVTENVFAMFKNEAAAKDLEFEHTVEACDIRSHPVELMRILSNLVSNAIKHTKAGSIKLSSHMQNGHIWLVVEDTGPGMSDQDLELFLKPYKKGDGSLGTGLGLHQVKTACDTLGHEFRMISDLGIGTQAQVIIERLKSSAIDF